MDIDEIADLNVDDFVGSIWTEIHDAHAVEQSNATRYPDINPNYELIPSLRKTKIEPGETVVIDIFLSGYGRPEITRLTAFASIEHIFEKRDDSVRAIPNVSGYIEPDGSALLIRGPASRGLGLVYERSFNGFPISTPIPPEIFVDDPGTPNNLREYAEHSYPNVVGESFVQNGASFRVEVDTKNAKWYSSDWYSGEYPIQLTFLYGDKYRVNIVKEEVSVEVKSRGEKFWWLTAVIAISAALTFIIRFLLQPTIEWLI